MKVSVDAKALYNLYDVLNSMKASQSNIIKIAKDIVSDMLPVLDVDGTAIEKHDDSQIPVRSREANIQAIKDALAKDPGKISVSHNISEIQKLIDMELINHRAILQIIDIMLNYSTCSRGANRDAEMKTMAKDLQSQLRGVRYEL